MATEHFSDRELGCYHCGETYSWPYAETLLEALRREIGPLSLSSAHRCALHNAKVDGAPLSLHKRLAFDIRLGRYDRFRLAVAAARLGFQGFGFGQTFLHVDTRRNRAIWFYGPVSKRLWNGVMLP